MTRTNDADQEYSGASAAVQRALAAIALKKGVKTVRHPLYGGHCAIDIASLAGFLVAD